MTETLHGSEPGTAGKVGIGSLNEQELKVIVKSSSMAVNDENNIMNKSGQKRNSMGSRFMTPSVDQKGASYNEASDSLYG